MKISRLVETHLSQGIVYSPAGPTITWAKIMLRHENLKSKEAYKEESYISADYFSQTGFLFIKHGIFLPEMAFVALFLKHAVLKTCF